MPDQTSTEYFSPAAARARHDAAAGFAEQMETADQAIRRERRPLPAHDLSGCNYRKWAAAVLAAEVKHARDDFWRAVHALGFAGHFHRDGADRDADVGFRFEYERLAGTAAVWLLHLQTHDSDRYGVWSRWTVMNRHERVAWCRRRRELLHGFLRACRHYRSARRAVDQTTVRRAA